MSLASVLALGSCADNTPAPAQGGLTLKFAALSAGGCNAHPNGTGQLPDGIVRLAARVKIGTATSERLTLDATKLDAGKWEIGPLPSNQTADVYVYGCDAAGKIVYQGRSNGIAIPDQAAAPVSMFMIPVGKLACTGNNAVNTGADESHHLSAPRSFSAAASVANGDVVVAGGVGDWNGESLTGLASLDTDVYDHEAGHFRKGPTLLKRRVWLHAHRLTDHHVLIAGGVGKIVGQSSALVPKLMAPTSATADRPDIAAEILDLRRGAGGKYPASVAGKVDIGVGKTFLSSSIATGDTITFVGGMADGGSALDQATRIGGLADIAAGSAGTTTAIALKQKRYKPALVAFGDGTIVVWGGIGKDVDAAKSIGETIAQGAKDTTAIVVSGPKEILESDKLATFGPAAAPIGESGGKLSFIVSGGMPAKTPTFGAGTSSYIVEVGSDGKAAIKTLDLGKNALFAGFGATALQLTTGEALFAGGIIALQKTAPCTGDSECLLDKAWLISPPASLSGDTVKTTAKILQLGGPRAGISAANLPSGVLLAGGQAKVFDAASKGQAALDPTGRVVSGAPKAELEAAMCGK